MRHIRELKGNKAQHNVEVVSFTPFRERLNKRIIARNAEMVILCNEMPAGWSDSIDEISGRLKMLCRGKEIFNGSKKTGS